MDWSENTFFSLIKNILKKEIFISYFKLFRSCKQIKYKLWANDNNITGDKSSSKSRVNDAKRL